MHRIEISAIILICSILLTIPAYTSMTFYTAKPNPGAAYQNMQLHIDGNKVKDASNSTVILRGVNYTRFIGTPYGDWIKPDGSIEWSTWDPIAAAQNLDAMKSWGINVVRTLATVEWWTTNKGNFQQNIKDWITMAAQRGIYVDLVFWRVSGSGTECSLPYPPYNGGANDTAIIPNQRAFTKIWANVASQLEEYPNVMFDLWNAPNDYSGANATTWLNEVQQCITAIRAKGATNLIVVKWGYGSGLDYEAYQQGSIWGMNWATQNPLTDATGNILYSTHIYPESFYNWNNSIGYACALSDIEWCLSETNVTSFSKALWVGESSANQWNYDLVDKYIAYRNILTVLNGNGIGYAGWDWWIYPGDPYGHLVAGGQNYAAAELGQILQDKIAGR